MSWKPKVTWPKTEPIAMDTANMTILMTEKGYCQRHLEERRTPNTINGDYAPKKLLLMSKAYGGDDDGDGDNERNYDDEDDDNEDGEDSHYLLPSYLNK